MNDYGVNLLGMRAIYSATQFYKRGASKEERTFICESGPGCDPKGSALPGFLFGARTIKARFSDGLSDNISSASIEAIINANGREVPKPHDGLATVTDIAYVVKLADEVSTKVFIPVKQAAAHGAETGRTKADRPNEANVPKEKAPAHPSETQVVPAQHPAAPRQDRDEIVSSPEFIALFEASRAKFKDPSRATCKRGHEICPANAHVGDMRRPPHRYSCDPCLRKVPAAPGFSE